MDDKLRLKCDVKPSIMYNTVCDVISSQFWVWQFFIVSVFVLRRRFFFLSHRNFRQRAAYNQKNSLFIMRSLWVTSTVGQFDFVYWISTPKHLLELHNSTQFCMFSIWGDITGCLFCLVSMVLSAYFINKQKITSRQYRECLIYKQHVVFVLIELKHDFWIDEMMIFLTHFWMPTK